MLERNRRRVGSTITIKYSKKCCQTSCLLFITVMNLIGVIVLIILFACHKAQEFRRNPPIFTSTLSFENFPPFSNTHFTRLTSDATHELLRTEFFENHRLPQAIWIFSDNLRTGPCCEIQTQLTPVYAEFTAPEASSPSFTPHETAPEIPEFDFQPSPYTDTIYPTITVSLPQTTEDPINEYFTGWAATVLPQTESIFTPKSKSSSEIFNGKLDVKQLFSNQINRIIGPPSFTPSSSTAENMGIFDGTDNNQFLETKEETKTSKIGPPSTAPDELQLKALDEKEAQTESVTDFSENTVMDRKMEPKNAESTTTATIKSDKEEIKTTETTKTISKFNNVLMGLPKGTTAIFLDCSMEKNQHDSRNCQAWKRAGYCNGHTATKYIFCRYQCLCASS